MSQWRRSPLRSDLALVGAEDEGSLESFAMAARAGGNTGWCRAKYRSISVLLWYLVPDKCCQESIYGLPLLFVIRLLHPAQSPAQPRSRALEREPRSRGFTSTWSDFSSTGSAEEMIENLRKVVRRRGGSRISNIVSCAINRTPRLNRTVSLQQKNTHL